MSLDVLKDLMEAAAQLDADAINIVWHGGEPLLAGVEFYRTALDIQRKLQSASGVLFMNALQTNGSLIDDKWLEFFAENAFQIGISLDGPEHIHNGQRSGANGRASYRSCLGGYLRLRTAGILPGIVSVIDPTNPPEIGSYFEWLRELDFPSFSLSPLFNNRSSRSTRYAQFVADLLKRLRSEGRLETAKEAHTIGTFGYHGHAGIWDACHPGWPCHESTSAVDPEGNIYFSCDRFMDGPNSVEHRVGHVRTTGFRAIYSDPKFQALAERANNSHQHCSAVCTNATICRGGCVADWMTIPSVSAAARPNVAFCEGISAAIAELNT